MGITSNDKLIIIESKQDCIKNEVEYFNYDVSDEDLVPMWLTYKCGTEGNGEPSKSFLMETMRKIFPN